MLSFYFLNRTKNTLQETKNFHLFICQKLYSRQRQISHFARISSIRWIVIEQVNCNRIYFLKESLLASFQILLENVGKILGQKCLKEFIS